MKTIRRLFDNRLTVDVIWNISSLIFLSFGGFLINGLIVAARGPMALGVFNQVYAVYIILSQLSVGGLQFSVLKHISYAQDDLDTCANITQTALVLVFFLTLPICAIGLLLGQPVGMLLDSVEVGQGLTYIMPGLIFFAANKTLINVLNGLRYMRTYAVFRSLRFIFMPIFIVSLLALDQPSSMLTLALTLTEIALFVCLAGYIYRRILPLSLPCQFWQYVRLHLSFGSRGMMSGVLLALNTRVDVLMLGLFVSDGVVGIYSFASILAEGFGQISMAVRYNVDPLLGTYFSAKQIDRIDHLIRQIRRVFVPSMIGLGVLAIIAYPLVYQILAGEIGREISWQVFVVLTLAHVIIAGYAPMRGILLQGDLPGTNTVVVIISIIQNVVLNALLIPTLDILGAAIATASTLIVQTLLIAHLAHRKLHVRI